jgi:hypothetical protein
MSKQEWAIQQHRQHWAQDTERRQNKKHNTENNKNEQQGPH